jgi:hypothetical protein
VVVVDAEADSTNPEEEFGDAFPARGVPGAQLFVGGQVVPDVHGLALIETREPIESIQVEAPGWVMLGLRDFGPNGHGLGFALMARE